MDAKRIYKNGSKLVGKGLYRIAEMENVGGELKRTAVDGTINILGETVIKKLENEARDDASVYSTIDKGDDLSTEEKIHFKENHIHQKRKHVIKMLGACIVLTGGCIIKKAIPEVASVMREKEKTKRTAIRCQTKVIRTQYRTDTVFKIASDISTTYLSPLKIRRILL